MSALRVRDIFGSMAAPARAQLKKLLPKTALPLPAVETARYPSALLGVLPKEQAYSVVGLVAEELLRLSPDAITVDALLVAVRKWVVGFPEAGAAKVRASKTTEPFLECVRETRRALDAVLRPAATAGPLVFNDELCAGPVAGHPDMRNGSQVFEVKLTGQLKTNWLSFLFQTFAYGALAPAVTDLYIVLPLQKTVWHADISTWAGRAAYLKMLQDAASHAMGAGVEAMLAAAVLVQAYSIGCHAPKQKSLAGTIAALGGGDYSKPYQIFLGGPTTSKMTIADEELALAASAVQKTGARVFVHSQYIINLCAGDASPWAVELLQKNLRYTAAMGGRGVVVHVGKSTGQPIATALEKMRAAITAALTAATPETPLLLETPAGQGSETLKDRTEFIEFVRSFADPRLRICVDTCHVFACGHDPLEYLEAVCAAGGAADEAGSLLKLVHFNDSQEACGSCLDRHAYIGTGKIGCAKMAKLAEFCGARGVPMVIE